MSKVLEYFRLYYLSKHFQINLEKKMSLMRTLGKVAMGVIVAKGVGKMMGGGRGGSSAGGGLGDLLGGLTGGSANGGGLGGILDSLSGGLQGGGLGGTLNDALQGKEVSANNEEEEQAEILLKAMLSAAKADGVIDEEEKRKITEHLGDVSDEDANFVRQELEAPLDT
ncbi:MAG: uncharacterized membrane protein YebE (DUF533 family) [Cocleimonas sp.]|jgi:uncharacterized membrane protein YebE (DUF533 family)